MQEIRQQCELCKGEASVYCEADAAFLCWTCDTRVHGANFLVARHVRAVACSGCRSFAAETVSGAGFAPICALCRFCGPAVPSSSTTSSYSSSCVSTAESASSGVVVPGKAVKLTRKLRRRRRKTMVGQMKAEKTKWSGKSGPASIALRVLGEYGGSVAEESLRVTMAAAVRREEKDGGIVRACERALRRIEAGSGVRARVILMADSDQGRVASRGRIAEEGWDECP